MDGVIAFYISELLLKIWSHFEAQVFYINSLFFPLKILSVEIFEQEPE